MIMQASQEADKVRREAQAEADQIRSAALVYSNDVLWRLKGLLQLHTKPFFPGMTVLWMYLRGILI